jgi:hypothetical protein
MNPRNHRMFLAAAATLALLLSASTALATSVRPFNLLELTQQAEKIFQGECVGARQVTVVVRSTDAPAMEYDFRVVEGIRGAQVGETVTFRQVGPPTFDPATGERLRSAPFIVGMPEYRVGRRYLLFLGQESEFGLNTPAGLHQGFFEESVEPNGRRAFINGQNNATLFHAMEADQRSNRLAGANALGTAQIVHDNVELSPSERAMISRRKMGPVAADDLLSLTRKLAVSPARIEPTQRPATALAPAPASASAAPAAVPAPAPATTAATAPANVEAQKQAP